MLLFTWVVLFFFFFCSLTIALLPRRFSIKFFQCLQSLPPASTRSLQLPFVSNVVSVVEFSLFQVRSRHGSILWVSNIQGQRYIRVMTSYWPSVRSRLPMTWTWWNLNLPVNNFFGHTSIINILKKAPALDFYFLPVSEARVLRSGGKITPYAGYEFTNHARPSLKFTRHV